MKYRSFSVEPVLNGFVIKIGCQTVVASSAKELVKLVEKYMEAPESTEETMLKNSFSISPEPVPIRGTLGLGIGQYNPTVGVN